MTCHISLISINTLSDLGDLSNLTGLLSRSIQQYSPPSEWIMCELGVFPIFLENNLLKVDEFLGLTFFRQGIACVKSVSVWLWSKKKTEDFHRVRNEMRAKKWRRGEGKGKEGNACRQTPRFWKPAFTSERSAWLARLVEQYWHVSIKALFHTERSWMGRDTHINFQWLLFILFSKICPSMQ